MPKKTPQRAHVSALEGPERCACVCTAKDRTSSRRWLDLELLRAAEPDPDERCNACPLWPRPTSPTTLLLAVGSADAPPSEGGIIPKLPGAPITPGPGRAVGITTWRFCVRILYAPGSAKASERERERVREREAERVVCE